MYNEAINSSQFEMLTSFSKYTCTVQVDKTKIDKTILVIIPQIEHNSRLFVYHIPNKR